MAQDPINERVIQSGIGGYVRAMNCHTASNRPSYLQLAARLLLPLRETLI